MDIFDIVEEIKRQIGDSYPEFQSGIDSAEEVHIGSKVRVLHDRVESHPDWWWDESIVGKEGTVEKIIYQTGRGIYAYRVRFGLLLVQSIPREAFEVISPVKKVTYAFSVGDVVYYNGTRYMLLAIEDVFATIKAGPLVTKVLVRDLYN